MKIININNQKGGVGKTTTVIAMANLLTERGNKVLIVDCDGSSTTLTKLIISEFDIKDMPQNTLTDLIVLHTTGRDISKDLARSIVIKCKNGYDLLPADNNLVAAITNLSMQNNLKVRFETIKSILNIYKESYDYVLLDSAPVLDIFSINQLIASDELIIVSQCQQASQNAIDELLKSVNDFVLPMNKELKIKGILLTMLDKRANYGKEQAKQMGSRFDIRTFRTIIPRSVKGEKYLNLGTELVTDRKNKVGEAYRAFVEEYLGG